MRRGLVRGMQGVILAQGAPLGWLLIRWMQGSPPAADLASASALYLYMLLGSSAVLAGAGALIGIREAHLLSLNDRLQELSITDALTGLRNARYFHARLDEEMAEHARTGRPLAVVVIDIDHFKNVNDTYGHAVGDDVLANTATAIASVTRQGETAARLGGEEFGLLLPGSTGPTASEAAERARRAIALTATSINGDSIRITASAGVASTAELGDVDAQRLTRAADDALYAAKAAGRNRTIVAALDPVFVQFDADDAPLVTDDVPSRTAT